VHCDTDGSGRHTCDCGAAPAGDYTCKGWISDLQKKILFNQDIIAINQQATPQGRPVAGGELSLWSRDMEDESKVRVRVDRRIPIDH
jgi:hypothetical protein